MTDSALAAEKRTLLAISRWALGHLTALRGGATHTWVPWGTYARDWFCLNCGVELADIPAPCCPAATEESDD